MKEEEKTTDECSSVRKSYQMRGENKLVFVEPPPMSKWECELFGMGKSGITWTPQEGNVPNLFWRWMQFICFGNRWVKK